MENENAYIVTVINPVYTDDHKEYRTLNATRVMYPTEKHGFYFLYMGDRCVMSIPASNVASVFAAKGEIL